MLGTIRQHYFEPSAIATSADLDAVTASDVVKFSGTHVTDESFTDRFPDKLFIRTLGADGLRFRLRGGRWVEVSPVECDDIVDWEGAGDWTSSFFLTKLAGLGKPYVDLDENDVRNCLESAQAVAAQSVRFLSSKGMIHSGVKPSQLGF